VGGIEVGEVIAVLAIFLGGGAFGVLVVFSMAIRRGDRRSTLTRRSALSRRAPDAAAHRARPLTGIGSSNISPPAEQDHCAFGIPGHWDGVYNGVNDGVNADGQPWWPGDPGTT